MEEEEEEEEESGDVGVCFAARTVQPSSEFFEYVKTTPDIRKEIRCQLCLQ